MDFITRTIVPMSVIFLLFVIFDAMFTKSVFQDKIYELFVTDDKNIKLGIFVVFSIGFGLIISIFHQFFDALNMKNFDCCISIGKNGRETDFRDLRNKVKEKLSKNGILEKLPDSTYSKDKLTDFKLYNILGNEKVFGKLIHVRRYNDQAKQLYTILIGVMLNFMMFGVVNYWVGENNIPVAFLFIVGIVFLGFLAVCTARQRYQARNTRLYINYLLQDSGESEMKSREDTVTTEETTV